MQYTDQQMRDFKSDYAARRRRQLFVLLPFILLIVLFVVTSGRFAGDQRGLNQQTVAIIMFVAVLALMSFSLYNWRCPACRKYLGRTHNPRHCPKCGVQLRD